MNKIINNDLFHYKAPVIISCAAVIFIGIFNYGTDRLKDRDKDEARITHAREKNPLLIYSSFILPLR